MVGVMIGDYSGRNDSGIPAQGDNILNSRFPELEATDSIKCTAALPVQISSKN
jgi:hypothetical protein